MNDPNELPESAAPAPESLPAPQAPSIDVDTAYDVIAQAEGWDPRLTRYEIQEHKRRVADFEREKQDFERQRSQMYQPIDDPNADPYMRRMDRIERMFIEEREEKRREREGQALVNRLGMELNSSYTQTARQSGMTKEQMEERSQDFYDTLNELYPDPGMLQAIGVERATRMAFRVLQANGHRSQPRPVINGRGPTASVVIPGVTTQASPMQGSDDGAQRPGESLEEYVMRRRQWRKDNEQSASIRDGVRYSSE